MDKANRSSTETPLPHFAVDTRIAVALERIAEQLAWIVPALEQLVDTTMTAHGLTYEDIGWIEDDEDSSDG